MTIRTVDLSGRYVISAIHSVTTGWSVNEIVLTSPALINPNWLHGDLDGAGDSLYPQNVTLLKGSSVDAVDLSGTYEIASVTADQITLVNPATVNPDWDTLADYPDGVTPPLSAYAALSGQTNWIGPFIVEDPGTAFLVVNVLATQGLYKDDGEQQLAANVTFTVEATPVDQNDDPTGPPEVFNGTVTGSAETKSTRALTLICPLTTPGRQSVRAKRTTLADYEFDGQVVDEIKWQDLYGMGPVEQPDFGNVTTVRTRTFATSGALAVKERKLNMLVRRKVPHWTGGAAFSAPAGSDDAADIFTEICRDEMLGNRPLSELDLGSIYDAVEAAQDYFGTVAAGQFGYTFDNDNTSFEEMASTVAAAAFSVAYRQGSTIRVFFERTTADSTLLFNHRNKIPGSETRTVRFGALDDNDGVELEFIDGRTDTPATVYLPADKSARKPRKVTAPGVRDPHQAYWLAWRAFNKLLYQNTTVEFTALPEAAPAVRNERILVADNTRPDTQDGDVEEQVGLELTLSQDVDLTGAAEHTIFLQLSDATVEAIPVTPGSAPNKVVLGRAPRLALSVDPAAYARATYMIVANQGGRSDAFLLTDKQGEDSGNYTVRAINYTGLYYLNDGLQLWLPFLGGELIDQSSYGRDAVAGGTADTVMDGERGKQVYDSGGGVASLGFPAFNPPSSYTKALWVKAPVGTGGGLLENGGESFYIQGGGGVLVAAHGGATVSSRWPASVEFHHAAVTYDAADHVLSLYIDGEQVGSRPGTANRAIAQLTAFSGFEGRADDLRLWNRALDPQDIRDLYRATRA